MVGVSNCSIEEEIVRGMFQAIRKILILQIFLAACTGDLAVKTSTDQGGMVINPGEVLTIDLQDIVAMNISNYKVELKSISNDYLVSKSLYDLKSFVEEKMVNGATSFSLTLPKSIGPQRPILIVVDVPIFNTQFIDVIFSEQTYARPGLGSTMAYNLTKFYGNLDSNGTFASSKTINQYTRIQFDHIRTLIQNRIDDLTTNSENLSWSATPYEKLVRYFTNGLANNINFLTAIQQDGIVYQWDSKTPTGLLAENTPEQSLNNYNYATNFKINNETALVNPFNHTNQPAELVSGSTSPLPGKNLFIQEGSIIKVMAQGHDSDEDFIDKNFQIDYTPRVLPAVLTQQGLTIPEPQASSNTITQLGQPEEMDTYQTQTAIAYNEALDSVAYPPDTTGGQTAFRDVYYLISDGMMYIPYRWNFKYFNNNRAPKFFKNSDGKINSTIFDNQLIPQNEQPLSQADLPVDTSLAPNTWYQHASHCEPETNNQSDLDYVFPITRRSHGPWSCAFKIFDPDLDDDPNAAPDQFFFSLSNINESTTTFGGYLQFDQQPASIGRLWPQFAPPIETAAPSRSAVIFSDVNECTDANGVLHRKCAAGLVQVKIDNSVKTAAESQSDSNFGYQITVFDRPPAVGGKSVFQQVARQVKFVAVPGRLVNHESFDPDVALAHSSTKDIDSATGNEYVVGLDARIPDKTKWKRWDTYYGDLVKEINDFNNSNSYTSTVDLTTLGLTNQFPNPINIGQQSRTRAFQQGTNQAISAYVTQPFSVTSSISVDAMGNVTFINAPVFTQFGNDLQQASSNLYSFPRQFDQSCNLQANNENQFDPVDPWSQHSQQIPLPQQAGSGGWVFEIDAIDYSNIGLDVRETSDPVYIGMQHDIQTTLNASGLMFCGYRPLNRHSLWGETYLAIPLNNSPVVDPDNCNWQPNVPLQMQPVPVYYQVNDAQGNPVVQKLVYHRLRMKWQPKNHLSTANGAPPPGFILNVLKNISLSGNRKKNPNVDDPLDELSAPIPLKLFAKLKEMSPCISQVSGGKDILSQANSTSKGLTITMSDENRTRGSSSALAMNPTIGRYEAEVNLLGTRGIQTESFLRFVPFFSSFQKSDPSTMALPPVAPLPTPVNNTDPLIFYSRWADPMNVPHARLVSTVLDFTTTQGYSNQGIMGIKFNASVLNKNNQPYNEVLVLENIGQVNQTINLQTTFGLASGCASITSLNVFSDQRFFVIPSTCGSSHSENQVLNSTNANFTLTVQKIFRPENYGFPAGQLTNYTMDIFPSLYGAFTSANNLDAANSLYFDSVPINTFVYDTNTQQENYTGFGGWVTSDPANQGSVTALITTPFHYASEYVDWDNQPIDISIITSPTPNPTTGDVFFWKSPSQAGLIEVYVKNHATATVDYRVTDSFSNLVADAFDVMQFLINPNQGSPQPVAIPQLLPIAPRTTCVDAPVNYPNVATLNYTNLRNYDTCKFQWTPSNCVGTDCTSTDDGKKFVYTLDVQDNRNANLNVLGVGARYPSGTANSGVTNDSGEKKNGPITQFKFQFESLEPNRKPYFFLETSIGTWNQASPNSNLYNPAGGATGWSSVFTTGTVGKQSSYATPTDFGISQTNSYTNDSTMAIQDGDVLLNSVPYELTEDSQTTFTVRTKDDNTTDKLKTIYLPEGIPNKVLLIHNQGTATYNLTTGGMVGFSAPALSGSVGNTIIQFTFKPNDTQARYLSSSYGFLIPVKISDTAYTPNSSTGFPTTFKVDAKTNRGWIWARLQVKNNDPIVYQVNGSALTSLDSSTLVFETGKTTTYNIRIYDNDGTRLLTDNNTGFNPVMSGHPSFLTSAVPAPTATPEPGTKKAYQNFTITGTPDSSQIGLYTNSKITITDPGDPTLGWALNPDSSTPPKASLLGGNNRDVSFKVQVRGKPLFIVPYPSPNPIPNPSPADLLEGSRVFAYTSNQFYYPISLNISRSEEKLNAFFIGIDTSTTAAPLKKDSTDGFYVTDSHVFRWSNPPFTQISLTNPTRAIPIMAVLKSKCSSSAVAGGKTIIRFKENSNGSLTQEYCYLSSAVNINDAATQNLNLQLVDGQTMLANLPAFSVTEAKRIKTTVTSGVTEVKEIDNEFADFYGRCTNCFGNYSGTPNGSPNTTTMTYGANDQNGFLYYDSNSFVSRFEYWKSPNSFKIEKTYQDNFPAGTVQNQPRSLSISAYEGEVVKLSAKLNNFTSANPLHYRWYVNGCLKNAGMVPNDSNAQNFGKVTYDLSLSDLSSGANNDCTGQHNINDTGSDSLGRLIVRLQVGNSSENPIGGNARNYVWNVSVLNSQPNFMTAGSVVYPPSDPVNFSSTANMITGTNPVDFAMSVDYSNKTYIAYTDRTAGTAGTGLSVRFRELKNDGSVNTAALALNQDCVTSNGSKYNSANEVRWIGIQPSATTITVSASTLDGYTSGNTSYYTNATSTCFGNTLSTTTPNPKSFYYSTGSYAPAGYLAFSKYAQAKKSTAVFYGDANKTVWPPADSDQDLFYFLESNTGRSQFWLYSMFGIHSTNNEMVGSNIVRKNIVDSDRLFQLIGQNSSVAANWRGFIKISKLTGTRAPDNKVTATPVSSIAFAEAAEGFTGPTCNFKGTPLTGVYSQKDDSLYVLTSSSSTNNPGGKIVLISNATTANPSCQILANVANPSVNPSEYNPNIPKMILDPDRKMVYGIIYVGAGISSQMFSIDLLSKRVTTTAISSSIYPYALVYSPKINALHVFDNRKSATLPALYKIW
jgi:hypothetical protein